MIDTPSLILKIVSPMNLNPIDFFVMESSDFHVESLISSTVVDPCLITLVVLSSSSWSMVNGQSRIVVETNGLKYVDLGLR